MLDYKARWAEKDLYFQTPALLLKQMKNLKPEDIWSKVTLYLYQTNGSLFIRDEDKQTLVMQKRSEQEVSLTFL